MTPVFLNTPHLCLRPIDWTVDDIHRYRAWLSDATVTRYLATGIFPVSEAALRAYVAKFQDSTTDMLLAIVVRDTQQHIGNVTLQHIDWVARMGETGLLIGEPSAWGQGYATEVWRALARYAFERLGLQRLWAGVVSENEASLRALQKVGFQVEGRLRRHHFIGGVWLDDIRVGLLREEFIQE